MRLIMEDYGFKPEDTFTPEQLKKMRSMKPEGNFVAHKKARVGRLLDRAPSFSRQGKPGVRKIDGEQTCL